MQRKHFTGMTVLAIVLLSAFAWRELGLRPDGKFHAYFLDVGQGDAALLVSPSGRQIVIDGGPDDTALQRIAEHMPFLDRTIDLLVLTHPDFDHIAAFPALLRRYRVSRVLMTGVRKPGAARYAEILALIKAQDIPVMIADPAKDLDLGDGLILDIAWPPPIYDTVPLKTVNDTGVVLRALCGTHSILFTADIEKKGEAGLLASGQDIRAEAIKVGHHGSRTSSSTGILLAVRPSLAVISAGRDNSYGHPHPDVLQRYAHFGIPVRVTAREGTISLAFDCQKS